MKPSLRPRVTYLGDELCIALIGPLLVSIARDEPTADLVKQIRVALGQLERLYGKHCGLLVIVRSNVRPPTEVARERIRAALEAVGGVIVCGSYVIEGEGFVAAANRGALSMMLMLNRRGFPLKVFGTIREAVPYLCNLLGPDAGLSVSELSNAIEQLRKEYDAGKLRAAAG